VTSRDHHVGRLRLDIQVLRAVAVGIVLLYHLWPGRFPGGFVGVDVFFVISGVLITAHLLREAEGTGIRLGRFWANRMRRLLPLAFVVLLATSVGALLLAPPSQLAAIMRNVIGSALYVENWMLAADSVDYLSRDQDPLPTQHFWSLSAEEQFYLVWPLLLVAATWIALRATRRRRTARRMIVRRAAFVVLVIVLVTSLTHSLVLTATDPGPAYFATTTRAWQFAAGGILAFVVDRGATSPTDRRSLVVRTAMSWAGALLIAGTTFLLTTEVPYPGVAALLPVAGTVLFLLGGSIDRWFAPTILMRVRPVTWLGDVSYGVYLWHWPLIVLVPSALGAPLGTGAKLGIVAASLLLAWGSKVAIEDPFRFGRYWRARTWRGLLVGAVGSVLVLVLPTATIVSIESRAAAAQQAVEDAVEEGLAAGEPDPSEPLVPSVVERVEDRGIMYDCFDFAYQGLTECTYGADESTLRIALVGDSHAAHLIPGLVDAVEAQGWSVSTFLGTNCDAGQLPACPSGAETMERVASGAFDVVVAAGFRGSDTPAEAVWDYWDILRAGPTPVLLVGDVPMHAESAYACIDDSGDDPLVAASCTTSRAEAIDEHPDRALAYAQETGAAVVDLAPALCGAEACESVVGNVIVYQDSPSSHMTATFSRLLDDVWVEALAPYDS